MAAAAAVVNCPGRKPPFYFGTLCTLRAQKKAPYKTDCWRRTLRAPDRLGRARSHCRFVLSLIYFVPD
jgi:hypothetical protein